MVAGRKVKMTQKRANRTTVQAVVRRLLAWPMLLILDAGIWACGCGKWFELRKASNVVPDHPWKVARSAAFQGMCPGILFGAHPTGAVDRATFLDPENSGTRSKQHSSCSHRQSRRRWRRGNAGRVPADRPRGQLDRSWAYAGSTEEQPQHTAETPCPDRGTALRTTGTHPLHRPLPQESGSGMCSSGLKDVLLHLVPRLP